MMSDKLHQRIFDKVAAHLLQQRRRSISDGSCMYRGAAGLRCAIGCLISNKAYSIDLEGSPAREMAVMSAVRKSGFAVSARDDGELLGDLQDVHDEQTPKRWPGALRRVASKHQLRLPKVLQT
jgi:hypothetical protein